MTLRHVVLLILLSACTEFPTFDNGVCGNFVLDASEDCDDLGANCVACQLLCDVTIGPGSESPVTSCPVDNYVCGADGFCHAGSGQFMDTGTVPFRGRNLTISQVDGDGIGDVVGVADNALSVHYGDGFGGLVGPASILTPQGHGQPAFARLDGDPSVDVLLPTADGIAGYSSPAGTLTAHSFAFDLKADAGPTCPSIFDPFHVFSIDDKHLAVLTDRAGKVHIAIIPLDSRTVCPDQPVAPVCDISVTNPKLNPPLIDVYTTEAPARFGKVIAIRTSGPGGGLCVLAAQKQNGSDMSEDYKFTNITPDMPAPGHPILADLDAVGDPTNDSGCPSLIISANGPGLLRELTGERGTSGECSLAALPSALPSLALVAPEDVRAIGHLALQPAQAGMGKDALVLETGVFAISASRASFETLYQSDRRLTYMASGDIDRDGDLDGVAIAATMMSGVEDIDILSRTSSGVFLLRRIDTIDPISSFTVGDYDGDEVADIVYSERVAVGERLMVIFGTRDLPLPAVELGSFQQIVGLCPVQVPDSVDLDNTVQDLVVLDALGDGAAAEPTVTILHGSPQRTLQSFIDPRIDGTSRSRFSGVVAGNFYGSPSVDVLAVELEAANKAELWPMRGTEIGDLATGPKVTTEIADCARRTSAGPGAPLFCGDTGHYIAWSLGNRDVVLGIDDAGANTAADLGATRQILMIDPMLVSGTGTMGQMYGKLSTFTPTADPVAASLKVRTMVAVDLDGDGSRSLAVSFGGSDTVPDEIRLCQIDPSGRPVSCPTLASLVPDLAGWTCVDMATAQLAPRGRDQPAPHPGSDLAVLCHGSQATDNVTRVFRVHHDVTTGVVRAAPLATFLGETGRRILAGDISGDALEDLVILEVDVPTSALHVLRQCASSDLACLGGSEDPPVFTQGEK